MQTRAKNIEAWRLKRDFGDRLTFYGGVDVQRLLPFGTEEDIRRGVKDLELIRK
jgi:uroporphyrinogen decarboxylase